MPFTTRNLLTFHACISFDNPDFHIHTLKNRIQTHTCVLGSLFRPAPGAQEMGRPATASPSAPISFYFLCRRSASIFLSFGALDLGIINVSPNNDTLSCIFSFQFVQLSCLITTYLEYCLSLILCLLFWNTRPESRCFELDSVFSRACLRDDAHEKRYPVPFSSDLQFLSISPLAILFCPILFNVVSIRF